MECKHIVNWLSIGIEESKLCPIWPLFDMTMIDHQVAPLLQELADALSLKSWDMTRWITFFQLNTVETIVIF